MEAIALVIAVTVVGVVVVDVLATWQRRCPPPETPETFDVLAVSTQKIRIDLQRRP